MKFSCVFCKVVVFISSLSFIKEQFKRTRLWFFQGAQQPRCQDILTRASMSKDAVLQRPEEAPLSYSYGDFSQLCCKNMREELENVVAADADEE